MALDETCAIFEFGPQWVVPLPCREMAKAPPRTIPAKRRVVDDLMAIGLEVVAKSDEPERGLAFRFIADLPGSDEPTTTGHDDGISTVNLAEADDAERERRRMALHEPYRTLIGHFRHESGHYYWDLLVAANEEVLSPFRELFGDERINYQEALRRHYDQGPPPDWR
jgi:hypothetical protein